MKFKIISLLLAHLLMMSLLVSLVHSSAIAMMKQVYECNHLKMVPKSDRFGGKIIVPDTSVSNNVLNDSFYVRQGLNSMTFDRAYDHMGKLYDAINKCKGNNCTCWNSYQFHEYDDHSVMFLNETILAQVKRIVSAFIVKYQPFLLPQSEIKKNLDRWEKSYTSTLINFSVHFDYSLERFYMYDTKKLPANEFYYRWGMGSSRNNNTVCFIYLKLTKKLLP